MQPIHRRGLLALPLIGLPATRAAAGSTGLRIVLPFGRGGGSEVLAQRLAQQLARRLGHEVELEFRPSPRGAAVGAEFVAQAPADGRTLLFAQSSHLLLKRHLQGLKLDPIADFAPVAGWSRSPVVLLVAASSGIDTVRDLIERIRAEPGRHRFGSPGFASGLHTASALLLQEAGLDAPSMPASSQGRARDALAAGKTTFLFDQISTALAAAREGKLRAIAIASASRNPLAPDLPTLVEAGFAGFDFAIWSVLLAPRDTPATQLATLRRCIVDAHDDPAVRDELAQLGAGVLALHDEASLIGFLQTEEARLTRLAERALGDG